MLFELSEEEIVRVVRRREGYTLLKALLKERVSRVIMAVVLASFIVGFVLSVLGNYDVWVSTCLVVGGLSFLTFVKRTYRVCKRDVVNLLRDMKILIED